MSNDSVDGDERPRGVLTQADRRFLRKSESERREDYSRQARSDARSRIRERTQHALSDFTLLHDRLDADDRNEIFGDSLSDLDGIHGMIAFLWQRATDSLTYDQDSDPVISPEKTLEGWLERGIYRAQTTNDPKVAGPALKIHPVDVSLEVENLQEISVEKINEQINDKSIEALSDNELQFLLWLGRREQVANESFMELDFETVLAEFTDRIDEEWGLRSQFILDPRAYDDDAERAERTEHREKYQETASEDEPNVPVGGDPWNDRYSDDE